MYLEKVRSDSVSTSPQSGSRRFTKTSQTPGYSQFVKVIFTIKIILIIVYNFGVYFFLNSQKYVLNNNSEKIFVDVIFLKV